MKKKNLLSLGVIVAVTGVLFIGCQKKEETSKDKPLVVFAQANSQDPWRRAMDKEMRMAYQKYKDLFTFEMKDAEDDPTKQIGVIESFMAKKPKLLLISPINEAVKASLDHIKGEKIPTVMLDRKIGSDYIAWVGGDNLEIGKKVGEYMAKRLNGQGTILMIQGTGGADATNHRRDGFLQALKAFPGIHVVMGDDCGYQRQKALIYTESFLTSQKPFDAIYAHNDEMAMGAAQAIEDSKVNKKIIIVGVDGIQREVMDYIKTGRMDATFTYPVPGKEGIELAAKIIKGEKINNKDHKLETEMIDVSNVQKHIEIVSSYEK